MKIALARTLRRWADKMDPPSRVVITKGPPLIGVNDVQWAAEYAARHHGVQRPSGWMY